MHNRKKDNNNKFKNKKQPELTENQTVWKSDNQGVKKETSRQVGGVESTHGKEAAGGPGKAAAGRAGSPTFAHR